MITKLANDEISVEVDVAYGARITSLFDRVARREWMLQGGHGVDVSDTAAYLGADAIGWDECFPTVAPWDASGTIWGSVLRDHGALWGRPAVLIDAGAQHAATLQSGSQFEFRRTLELDDTTLHARYQLTNLSDQSLPYLWAAHGMLRATPSDRIVLPGVKSVIATYLSRDGHPVDAGTLQWPGPSTQWAEPLDHIQPVSTHRAAKLYVPDIPDAAAYVGGDGGWLRIGWSAEIDSLGIWLNYGGWPAPGDVHHIGLEPTNAPVDHLGAAIDRGTPALAPHARSEWSISYTLRAAAPE